MIDAAERGMGDDVVALDAAVIGMGAPPDVGKQAGGLAQTRLVLGFLDAEFFKSCAGPIGQFTRMLR
jgi:hypothetical protein